MDKILYLRVKKTNKHFYLYILSNGKQVITVSTGNKQSRSTYDKIGYDYTLETIVYVLSQKIIEGGLCNIYLKQDYAYHGNIRSIVELLVRYGIPIK